MPLVPRLLRARMQAGHREADERLRTGGQVLVVCAQSATFTDPGEGLLHDPALRRHGETVDIICASDDLPSPACPLARPSNPLTGLAPVGTDPFQAWHRLSQWLQEELGHVPIPHVGGVDGQPQRNDDVVSLAPENLLAHVIAAPPFSTVFTDYVSLSPAEDCGSRSAARRTWARNSSWTCSKSPSSRQRRKFNQIGPPGTKSCGSCRQKQPVRGSYKREWTASRRSTRCG